MLFVVLRTCWEIPWVLGALRIKWSDMRNLFTTPSVHMGLRHAQKSFARCPLRGGKVIASLLAAQEVWTRAKYRNPAQPPSKIHIFYASALEQDSLLAEKTHLEGNPHFFTVALDLQTDNI